MNLTLIVLVLVAACIGSFLNVCIYRLPRGQSIVRPRSHCPNCGRFLKWIHNVPLLSFLFLKGRCRYCRHPISWRYPLVELLSVLLALLAYGRFGLGLEFGLNFLFLIAPLIVVSFIDLEHRIIPDVISIPGIGVGILVHLALSTEGWQGSLLQSGLGILLGGGFLFLVGFLYEKIRGVEGLGGGDVKLAALLGAFLGWQNTLFILPVAAMGGLLVGLVLIVFFRKGMQYQLPYGPFLALAGLLQLFYGETMIRWYLGLLGH